MTTVEEKYSDKSRILLSLVPIKRKKWLLVSIEHALSIFSISKILTCWSKSFSKGKTRYYKLNYLIKEKAILASSLSYRSTEVCSYHTSTYIHGYECSSLTSRYYIRTGIQYLVITPTKCLKR